MVVETSAPTGIAIVGKALVGVVAHVSGAALTGVGIAAGFYAFNKWMLPKLDKAVEARMKEEVKASFLEEIDKLAASGNEEIKGVA